MRDETRASRDVPDELWLTGNAQWAAASWYATEEHAQKMKAFYDRENPGARPHTVNRYIHDSVIACSRAERDAVETALGLVGLMGFVYQRPDAKANVAPLTALLVRMKVVP